MTLKEFQQEVFQWAKRYIARGWLVFPLHTILDDGVCSCGKKDCTDAGKHPRIHGGLKRASKDPKQIEEWFGPNCPPSNIAIRTGQESGITFFDIDIGPGKQGAESWRLATVDKGEPPMLISQTGSGGTHGGFAYNSAVKTATNVLGKGVDSRGDGGYIVAAPSRHRSGGVYKWLNWEEFEDTMPILPAHLTKRKETRGRKKKDEMVPSLEQTRTMLMDFIPPDDRDLWRAVGIALGRAYNRSNAAWDLYNEWANKWQGKRGRNHDQIMQEAFHEISMQPSEKEIGIGTIIKAAIQHGWVPRKGEVPISNFIYHGPGNDFIYRPTVTFWVAAAVDAAVAPVNVDGRLVKPSDWLKEHQLATSLTCDPKLPDDYIKGYDCNHGEMVKAEGAAVFNTYRHPIIELGDARLIGPYLDHIRKVFPRSGDADQFLDYMAHRAQKPWEKPRFALLIAGGQGVGKDTAIEFACQTLGSWNVANIEPRTLDSGFNEYATKTLIRISEAANLHEMTRWAFNERVKVLIAGLPDVVEINPKYGQKYTIKMHCGVILTTNHLANGIYIPPDDRRFDVIETATLEEMGLDDEIKRGEYFSDLWEWFAAGGSTHVAAFLHERDIAKFNAATGQRKTAAHTTVVASSLANDQWLDDIIDELGEPIGVRADWIIQRAVAQGEKEPDIKRKLANSIARIGYSMFRNPTYQDGRWKINGKKVTVYVKTGTPASFNPITELAKELF